MIVNLVHQKIIYFNNLLFNTDLSGNIINIHNQKKCFDCETISKLNELLIFPINNSNLRNKIHLPFWTVYLNKYIRRLITIKLISLILMKYFNKI